MSNLSKCSTIYFEPNIYRALKAKAASAQLSVDRVEARFNPGMTNSAVVDVLVGVHTKQKQSAWSQGAAYPVDDCHGVSPAEVVEQETGHDSE